MRGLYSPVHVPYLQGAMIGGSRCYFLKGDGVLLNQALINYGIAFLANKNYVPLQVSKYRL